MTLARLRRFINSRVIIIFLPGENPWWLKNYKSYKDLFGSVWPVVISKTIVQQNRIKSLHYYYYNYYYNYYYYYYYYHYYMFMELSPTISTSK